MTDAYHLRVYLGKGRANATKQSVLAKSLGWFTPEDEPDTRRVQRAAGELRDDGIIVASACSPPHGAYIVITAEEISAYKGQLFARVNALLKTARQIDAGWEAEFADELFHKCRACPAMIPRDVDYCNTECRTAYHTRAREVGYAQLEGAA